MQSTEYSLCWIEAHSGNPDGECTSVREILESECAKAKPIIDATLGNKWPFCEILNEYFKKCSSGDNPGNPPRLYNDAELYWLEPTKLFGKPAYNVRRWLRAKPAAQFFDKEKAEKYINTENAYIYLQSRIKDRRFLIGIAEKVGLKEDELEGFSNASILGEITGSDDYAGIVKELAGKIPSSNPGNPYNPGLTRYTQRGQTLPGRQMWLLEMMCRRAGIDTAMIDPNITYWENKAEIEREEHVKLHLKEKKDNHEREALARQVRALSREEAEDFAEYLRSIGKNH